MGNDPPISLRKDLEHLMLLVSLIFLLITVTNNNCHLHLSSENPYLNDTIWCWIFSFWDDFFSLKYTHISIFFHIKELIYCLGF